MSSTRNPTVGHEAQSRGAGEPMGTQQAPRHPKAHRGAAEPGGVQQAFQPATQRPVEPEDPGYHAHVDSSLATGRATHPQGGLPKDLHPLAETNPAALHGAHAESAPDHPFKLGLHQTDEPKERPAHAEHAPSGAAPAAAKPAKASKGPAKEHGGHGKGSGAPAAPFQTATQRPVEPEDPGYYAHVDSSLATGRASHPGGGLPKDLHPLAETNPEALHGAHAESSPDHPFKLGLHQTKEQPGYPTEPPVQAPAPFQTATQRPVEPEDPGYHAHVDSSLATGRATHPQGGPPKDLHPLAETDPRALHGAYSDSRDHPVKQGGGHHHQKHRPEVTEEATSDTASLPKSAVREMQESKEPRAVDVVSPPGAQPGPEAAKPRAVKKAPATQDQHEAADRLLAQTEADVMAMTLEQEQAMEQEKAFEVEAKNIAPVPRDIPSQMQMMREGADPEVRARVHEAAGMPMTKGEDIVRAEEGHPPTMTDKFVRAGKNLAEAFVPVDRTLPPVGGPGEEGLDKPGVQVEKHELRTGAMAAQARRDDA